MGILGMTIMCAMSDPCVQDAVQHKPSLAASLDSLENVAAALLVGLVTYGFMILKEKSAARQS